jgi:hypothetical protein
MHVTPVPPSLSVVERLHESSIRHPGLKVSLFIKPGASAVDVERVVEACWDDRPREMSPMMLQAVLRHVRSCATDLVSLHRHRSPGLGCFALLDGSIHDDVWLLLPSGTPMLARVGPRFHLTPLRPREAVEAVRHDAELALA